jgi:anaerobic dimethyl sulfoxide reductase subunit B (iron-sulfur subunit)
MTYSFSFDARFCSGCKACQAACKDKNNLPLGVLWRRVIEVSGGTWQRQGAAWTNTVFAYNLSIACNHCVHPKCVGICPTGAYAVRDDGIVLLDTSKCMGCGYCAWACPYGAPQYNPEAGTMTKCNFCFDQIEQGLPPACVAACPLRVLDYEETESGAKGLRLWEVSAEEHPYPLPCYSHTQPRLAIQPHAGMQTRQEKSVANLEEIQPRPPSKWEDLPLVLFTLLMQMAVGGFWALMQIYPRLWILPEFAMASRQMLRLIGICISMGMLSSLAHLGTKKRAWRALGNLRKSRLSREILFTGLFGAGWLLTTLNSMFWLGGTVPWTALTATFGICLVYSMAGVYRLPAVPVWNTWRTNLVFILSALLLGQSLMALALPEHPNAAGDVIVVLLFLQLLMMWKWLPPHPLHLIRVGTILAAMILSILSSFLLDAWINTLLFLIVVAEEGMGRWSFYQARTKPFAAD